MAGLLTSSRLIVSMPPTTGSGQGGTDGYRSFITGARRAPPTNSATRYRRSCRQARRGRVSNPPLRKSGRSSSTYGAHRPRSAARRQRRPPHPGNLRQLRPPGALSGAIGRVSNPPSPCQMAGLLTSGRLVVSMTPSHNRPGTGWNGRVSQHYHRSATGAANQFSDPIPAILPSGEARAGFKPASTEVRPIVQESTRGGRPCNEPRRRDTTAALGAGRPARAPSQRGPSAGAGPSRRRS